MDLLNALCRKLIQFIQYGQRNSNNSATNYENLQTNKSSSRELHWQFSNLKDKTQISFETLQTEGFVDVLFLPIPHSQ